ncbi:MAG: SPOR domain-containing protein [Bacteroidales bacterium]|nr:SPOR domain-containing protein [Candidatus Sodaliphilus aphodohippi]
MLSDSIKKLASLALLLALSAAVAMAQVNVNAPKGLSTRSNNNPQKTEQPAAKPEAPAAKAEQPAAPAAAPATANAQPAAASQPEPANNTTANTGQQNSRPAEVTIPANQQVMKGRCGGYRIQAYNDNTNKGRINARARARAIALKFPRYRAYITFRAPTWRLRIGDFQDQKSAQDALKRIKAVFPDYARDMAVVRDNINLWGR